MRHIIYKRILASLCVLLIFAQLIQVAYKLHVETERAEDGSVVLEPEHLLLWYTDDNLTTYLLESVKKFEAENNVKITLQLVTAVDYVEHINSASIADENGPDLFVMGSDLLDKTRLAGLTIENDSFTAGELGKCFPQKALDAASCGDSLVAYPFYFETCYLLYNKNYVEEAPKTIDDILAYADTFEGGDGMEAIEDIFKWNVEDIFYNHFFISEYVNMGGKTGDDIDQVDVSAPEVDKCMEYYQSLNAFFAIDAEEVIKDDIIQEFIDGKIVYTIAKTDAILRLDEANADFYGIAKVPDLTDELLTKGVSITNSVVVNAYSKERKASKAFAKYLTCENVDSLYTLTNKMPVCLDVEYENPQMSVLNEQYEESLEVTKITALSDYWLTMEIVFSNIWKGADVPTTLDEVENKIQNQIALEES